MNRDLIVLLVAGVILGGSFFAGYREGKARCEAAANVEKLAAIKRAIEQAEELARQDSEVSTTAETGRQQRAANADRLNTAIDRYFSHPHPNPLPPAGEGVSKDATHATLTHDCGLNADGLRLWNAANSGADLNSPGVLDAGVRRLAPGQERRPGDAHPQPQDSDGSIPRLPGGEPGKSGADPQSGGNK